MGFWVKIKFFVPPLGRSLAGCSGPTPYRHMGQIRRDHEAAAISRGIDAENEQFDVEENTPGATPVCPWASWIEYGLFTCVLLLFVLLPSLVVFTTDTSFVSPTCPLSVRQGIAATPAASGCTGLGFRDEINPQQRDGPREATFWYITRKSAQIVP